MFEPLTPGAVRPMTGFVTRASYLRMQTASELERRLGYTPGRLDAGWWLLWLMQIPSPDDFEFAGYTQMSGGVPHGHLAPAGRPAIEQSMHIAGWDVTARKRKVIADAFRIAGRERLAKVAPVNPAAGPMPYPPGSGIPQWKIVAPGLPFRVVQFIPGDSYYTGDFA